METQPIQSISGSVPVTEVTESLSAPKSAPKAAESFENIFSSFVHQSNDSLMSADSLLEGFADGSQDLHHVVLETVKADLNFRLFLEMRNKLTESYQELSRMQF